MLLSLKVRDLHCLNVMWIFLYYHMNKWNLNQLTCNKLSWQSSIYGRHVTVSTKTDRAYGEENSCFICVTSHLWVHWLWWINTLKQINMLKVKFYHYLQNCITGMLIFHDIWWITPSYHILTKTNTQNTNVKKKNVVQWASFMKNSLRKSQCQTGGSYPYM